MNPAIGLALPGAFLSLLCRSLFSLLPFDRLFLPRAYQQVTDSCQAPDRELPFPQHIRHQAKGSTAVFALYELPFAPRIDCWHDILYIKPSLWSLNSSVDESKDCHAANHKAYRLDLRLDEPANRYHQLPARGLDPSPVFNRDWLEPHRHRHGHFCGRDFRCHI